MTIVLPRLAIARHVPLLDHEQADRRDTRCDDCYGDLKHAPDLELERIHVAGRGVGECKAQNGEDDGENGKEEDEDEDHLLLFRDL